MARQFIAATFRPGGRPYTYHNDGAPLAPGHTARVNARDGMGWQNLDVIEAGIDKPPFDTKPIIPADWIDAMTADEAREYLTRATPVRKTGEDDLFGGDSISEAELERLKSKSMRART